MTPALQAGSQPFFYRPFPGFNVLRGGGFANKRPLALCNACHMRIKERIFWGVGEVYCLVDKMSAH